MRPRWRDSFAPFRRCCVTAKSLAYHDRSDGGLAVCALEMAFAGRCGFDIDLAALGVNDESGAVAALFAEELGAVLQVAEADAAMVRARFADVGLGAYVHDLGIPQQQRRVDVQSRPHDLARCRRRGVATSLGGNQLSHAADARRSRLRGRRVRAHFCGRSRHARNAHVRSGRRRGSAVREPWRAPACRGVARAGCEQPSRNGRGVRSCRLRSRRRAHVRSARESPER